MSRENRADVIVVGAGIAGVMAASRLQEAGLQVIVAEANPFAGGRMVTRQIGPGFADTGAQFFTARSEEFLSWVDRWLAAGLIFEWSQGWSDGSLGTVPPSGHPRYAARGGMSALIAALAERLDIRFNTRLISIETWSQGWQMRDDRGRILVAPTVILTPPMPQALDLITAGQVKLTAVDRALLDPVSYDPCLAGIFWIDGPVHIPDPGAVQRPNAPITWIANNRSKGISPGATLITVHAGPEYSRQLWDEPERDILRALESSLNLFKDAQAHTVQAHLERWLYAMPAAPLANLYLVAGGLPPLIFAGDSFSMPRVEGAALSGLAAASALVSERL